MWQAVVFLFEFCSKNILLSFVEHRLIMTWHVSHQTLIALHGSSLWLVTQSSLASPIQMLGMHFPDEVQLSLLYACIHTHGRGLDYIHSHHIHLSCLLFHHLLSIFQSTHHFCNKHFCLNNTFHPTNHHIRYAHRIHAFRDRVC